MLLLQLLINGLIKGGTYAVIALGFALIYRGARVFHIAHGSLYTLGAYTLYGFHNLLHIPFFLSAFVTLGGLTLLGMLSEIGVYSPLSKRKASPAVIIIASLSLYIVVTNVLALLFGNETKVIFSEISRSYSFREIIITKLQLVQITVSIFCIVLVILVLSKTDIGISIKALANNPLLSAALGFDIRKIRIIIFAIGSLLVGVAAILISSDVGMAPWDGMSIFLSGVVAMIIGGTGRWEGPILGGFLLGIVQGFAIWRYSERWQDVVTFGLLVAFLFLRPQGILSGKERAEKA